MSIKINKTDWAKAIQPLIKKYKGKKHPLDYKNNYQLLVMVILSAQDSDKHINQIAPPLFAAFPNMQALARADTAMLNPYIEKVRGFARKAEWLVKIAKQLKDDKSIPLSMDELVKLSGIGRKSANVIMREAGIKASGVMVDLHVVRVANRLGIADSENPKIIEEQIMEKIPEKDWGETGMAISFLGRETCRPSNPMHSECVMKDVCKYYHSLFDEKKKTMPGK